MWFSPLIFWGAFLKLKCTFTHCRFYFVYSIFVRCVQSLFDKLQIFFPDFSLELGNNEVWSLKKESLTETGWENNYSKNTHTIHLSWLKIKIERKIYKHHKYYPQVILCISIYEQENPFDRNSWCAINSLYPHHILYTPFENVNCKCVMRKCCSLYTIQKLGYFIKKVLFRAWTFDGKNGGFQHLS